MLISFTNCWALVARIGGSCARLLSFTSGSSAVDLAWDWSQSQEAARGGGGRRTLQPQGRLPKNLRKASRVLPPPAIPGLWIRGPSTSPCYVRSGSAGSSRLQATCGLGAKLPAAWSSVCPAVWIAERPRLLPVPAQWPGFHPVPAPGRLSSWPGSGGYGFPREEAQGGGSGGGGREAREIG